MVKFVAYNGPGKSWVGGFVPTCMWVKLDGKIEPTTVKPPTKSTRALPVFCFGCHTIKINSSESLES